jgi:formylmethanofuran dehydrogenase subunit E
LADYHFHNLFLGGEMILSTIAIAISCLLLGALIVYIVMQNVLRNEYRDYLEAHADAVIRQKNAESVATKYAQMQQEQQRLFRRHGSVHCNRCGKYTRYAESYIDHDGGCFLCKVCAQKSLDKKVQHV